MERKRISDKEMSEAIKATKSNNNGYPRMLPVIKIKNKKYFIDERLKELRNVNNPHDAIRF